MVDKESNRSTEICLDKNQNRKCLRCWALLIYIDMFSNSSSQKSLETSLYDGCIASSCIASKLTLLIYSFKKINILMVC